jgi:hypothetical protein
MSRSFVWLVTLSLGGGALGCSDPVPAAAAVGLRLNLTQSASCAANNALNDDIGNPPPDKDRLSADPKKGRPVFDGEGGLRAQCTVSGSGPFTIGANVSSGSVSFGITQGTMSATGAGSALMSFSSAAIGTSISATTPCSLTAVPTSEGPGIKAGAVWATFSCSNLTQSSSPNINCSANGEILLENCDQ